MNHLTRFIFTKANSLELARSILITLGLILLCPRSGGSQTIDLRDIWQFRLGDSLTWAQPDYLDSAWDYLSIPQDWESAGFSYYNGFAWYRKKCFLPAAWGTSKHLLLKGYLTLNLGQIDDVDQTYFNGHLVGTTGQFPPNFISERRRVREYNIPCTLVRWGEINLIAIRVYDQIGKGGIYSGKPFLRVPSQMDYVEMKVDLDKTNATYGLNESVTIRTTFFNNSFDTLAATLNWLLKPEFLAPIDSFEQAIVVPVGTTKTFSRSFNCTREGLYQLSTQVLQNQTRLLETENVLGYAMQKVRTKLTARSDFQNFWLRTRQQLSMIPLQMKIGRIDSLETPLSRVFKVRLLSFDNGYIFGTYIVPRKIGKFPVILEIQNFAKPSAWLTQPVNPNFAIFSLCLRNPEHATNVQNPDLAEYLLWNVDNKEKYFFRGVIMDAMRAVDFLISRPEIDTTRLAIVGESLSAAVAFAVAALDARVKLVAIDVPLLTAFETATKYVVYPYHDIIQYVVDNPQQKKDTFDTLSYFDLINFAGLLRCPVLLGIGLKDTISPPLTSFLLYNYIRTEKNYRIYPTGGHEDTPGKHWKTKVNWLKTKFNLNN